MCWRDINKCHQESKLIDCVVIPNVSLFPASIYLLSDFAALFAKDGAHIDVGLSCNDLTNKI